MSMSQPISRRAALRVAGGTGSARIVQAGHERLIVTYSVRDDIVYVLTPPGEDPAAVLRAARLVLPDDTYEDLASHLGVSADWASE
jgi:hypothetical protein